MAIIALTVLGEFQTRDGAGREIAIGSEKNRALLCVLALSPSGSLSRERIARLLWSDRADEQARSSLRQALAALRKDLAVAGPAPIIASDSRVKLDLLRTEVDALEFQRLAVSTEIDSLRAAIVLYRGELLADIEVRDAAFEEWLQAERRRFADLAATVLEKLWAREIGAPRVDAAKRLVALDPIRENAHRKLIQAYAEGGERTLALRQYESCRDMLKAAFNVAPEEETEALLARVQNDSMERGGAPAGGNAMAAAKAPPRGKPSVAVLPFLVLPGKSTLDAFSDGLTEDITTGLSRIKAVRVIARSTMFTYKGRTIDIRDLGRELGVKYVLEGSVRNSGTRMRITAQLIEAASGHHIWAERIDSTSADIFQLQDDITSKIVASVQTQIILNEGRVAGEDAGESVANLLARSWQQFLGLNRQPLASSRLLAKRALLLDGNSGMAHRMLAVALYHQVYMGFVPWTEAILDDIFSHAKFSIETEDADEYCHWAMACAHLLRKEHARGLASLQRALEINPNCSLAHGSIGTNLAWSGQSGAAIESNELALRMNPDDPTNFFRHLGLALAHFLASRHDKAIFHASSVLQTRPQWWLGLLLNAASLAQTDQIEKARQALGELDLIRPEVTCGSLHVLPFLSAHNRESLLDGLRKAGMPEGT